MRSTDPRYRQETGSGLALPKLTPEMCQQVFQSMLGKREFERKPIYSFYAKRFGVDKDMIRQQVMRYAVDQIRSTAQGGEIRHYHRTSLEAFGLIAREGKFLSHSLLRERIPEFNIPRGSSSNNVMFTRDMFSKGTLVESGISENSHGAKGSKITFVMKESIMDSASYDATSGGYPTVSELLIAPHCECLLVSDPEDLEVVASIIIGTKLSDLPVFTREQWQKK